MASLLSSRVARAQLFQLPPTVRASIFQHVQKTLPRRTFSATTTRKDAFVETAESTPTTVTDAVTSTVAPATSSLTDAVVAVPTAVLDGIHGLGVPWWAAIPLTAVLVRGTIIYYLAALPARKRAIIRTYLAPLASVRAKRANQQAFTKYQRSREGSSTNKPDRLDLALQWTTGAIYHNIMQNHKVGKKFGAPVFTWRMFMNFGTLILFAEAIRVKCGTREGLLSYVMKPFEQIDHWFKDLEKSPAKLKSKKESGSGETANAGEMAETAAAPTDPSNPAELLADRTQEACGKLSPNLAQGEKIDVTALSEQIQAQGIDLTPVAEQQIATYAHYIDPAMLTEGLSWAQNLTIPDPTPILPCALGLIILSGAFRKPNKTSDVQNRSAAPQLSKSRSTTSEQPEKPSHALDQHVATAHNDVAAALAAAEKLNTSAKKERRVDRLFPALTFGQRISITMAGLFGLMASNLPVGIVLYLITNILMGQLQARWLDVKYPLPEAIRPCKRPMRIKVRKMYGET